MDTSPPLSGLTVTVSLKDDPPQAPSTESEDTVEMIIMERMQNVMNKEMNMLTR
jgi:hypothetical protein